MILELNIKYVHICTYIEITNQVVEGIPIIITISTIAGKPCRFLLGLTRLNHVKPSTK